MLWNREWPKEMISNAYKNKLNHCSLASKFKHTKPRHSKALSWVESSEENVNFEWKRIWEKAVVNCFKILFNTGWTVRGSNPGESEIFRTHPDRPSGPPSILDNRYRVFPGVKRPGRGVDYPPPSGAKVKERVELYLYSPHPPGPSWPVLGWPFPLLYVCIHL